VGERGKMSSPETVISIDKRRYNPVTGQQLPNGIYPEANYGSTTCSQCTLLGRLHEGCVWLDSANKKLRGAKDPKE
jgi:hypothetical protein